MIRSMMRMLADVLRVDAQGSNFSFSINDQPVSQVTDADYATGEVGLYVQTFDVAKCPYSLRRADHPAL